MNRACLYLLGLFSLVATPASAVDPALDSVTMDLKEFLDLYEKTHDPRDTPELAPRDASLASARYAGEVLFEDGEPTSASMQARFHVEVHKNKGWVRVPLLPGSVGVSSARIDGKEASIVLEGGFYTLVTDRKGAFDVTVDFGVKVETKTGQSGFAFQLVPSGSASVELSVPSAEALDFIVTNAQLQTDKVVGTKRVVTASLPSSGWLSVQWQREIPEEEKKNEPRVYSEVYSLISVGEGLLRATTTVQDTILFAGVDTFRFQVPKGSTVLDVRGQGLRDWNVTPEGELTVVLNYAAENSYTVAIDTEQTVGEGSLNADAPLVTPLNVQRSKGWVGVEARGALEIAGGEVKNATGVDVRTLPGQILGITDQPVLLGYKYLGTDARVPLIVTAHDDVDVLVTLLDQAEATTMFTHDGRRLSQVRYEVRNNRRQFLRVSLPAGAELWSAAVAGRAVTPAKGSDGTILVPLVRSQTSGGSLASFDVEVVYVESGQGPDAFGKGSFRAELPKVDVPTTYVAWTVYAPEVAKVKKSSYEGTVRHVDWLSRPLGAMQVLNVTADIPMQMTNADSQVSSGALGDAAAPVRVRLPVEGTPYYFEKLLALDEGLWVEFDYSGLKDK